MRCAAGRSGSSTRRRRAHRAARAAGPASARGLPVSRRLGAVAVRVARARAAARVRARGRGGADRAPDQAARRRVQLGHGRGAAGAARAADADDAGRRGARRRAAGSGPGGRGDAAREGRRARHAGDRRDRRLRRRDRRDRPVRRGRLGRLRRPGDADRGRDDRRAAGRAGPRPLRAAARGRRRLRDPRLHALSARAPDHPAHARPGDRDRDVGRAARAPGRARPLHRRAGAVPGAGDAVPPAAARRGRARAARRGGRRSGGGVTTERVTAERSGGRAAGELRPVSIEPGFVPTATGSVLISCGETRVICTASVQESVPRWMAGKGRGWVTAEYAMLPASTGERKARDVSKGRPDGRTVEIQRLIGRSLRGVVDFEALGERTIYVDCDVLTADGGTRCAAITGGFVALDLALRRLVDEAKLATVPLTGTLAAVSCGIVGGVALLDLDYSEDSTAEVDANVVMTGDGGLVEVQATAERTPLSRTHLDELLALAQQGIEGLRAAQAAAVG